MNYYLIFLGVVAIAMVIYIVKKAFSLSQKLGDISHKLQDEKEENELQSKYLEIAARPSSNVESILGRMRESNDNK
jgi:hypothetical protein